MKRRTPTENERQSQAHIGDQLSFEACASVSWCCKGMTAASHNDPFMEKVQQNLKNKADGQ